MSYHRSSRPGYEFYTQWKKNKNFSYPALWTFTVRKKKPRKGRNPQTGEEIQIDTSKTVGFHTALTFKGLLQ